MKLDSLPGIGIFRACEYDTHMTYVHMPPLFEYQQRLGWFSLTTSPAGSKHVGFSWAKKRMNHAIAAWFISRKILAINGKFGNGPMLGNLHVYVYIYTGWWF